MANPPNADWWPEGPIPRPESAPASQNPHEPPTPAATPRTEPRRGGRALVVVLVALVAGALAGGGTAVLLTADDANQAATPPPTTEPGITTVVLEQPDNGLDEDLGVVSTVAARVLPSVVRVQVLEESLDENGETIFLPIGTGSGVGYTAEGHLLTNSHVVEDADRIEIELVDGRIYDAELIGADPVTDVAVIKVAPGLVQPIPIADRNGLAIGDAAIAVGNPLGLVGGPSVSVGVISAFERELSIDRRDGTERNLQGLIQTDAAISGGSSGGALVNQDGALIGITTAKSVGSTTEGVGFAVPVDLVEGIANDLITEGAIEHPFLGISGRAAYEELPDGAQAPAGAEIVEILDSVGGLAIDSALGEAGGRAGDVIVAMDDIEISTMNQLASLLRRYRAGQEVTITVQRDGAEVVLDVTLGNRPADV
ncbi:MAG: trypsin-like peptidase domain-containing protein [Acidimicrobiia bacterium]